jgi:hypothetical protein
MSYHQHEVADLILSASADYLHSLLQTLSLLYKMKLLMSLALLISLAAHLVFYNRLTILTVV